MEPTSASNNSVKSTAVVKYSAAQTPATFAQLQCNTDLNLPPSNWLSSSADSYGFQHVFPHQTGFSSFRMAHMFPDCVGEVDVVSDAENIKNLLKIPYSNGHISMMVHRIENTLLIDEFDIYKHLLRTAESDWEWFKKFFYEHIRTSFSAKDRHLYVQNKSRRALQQKSLVSKFLYHSLVETEPKTESSNSDNGKSENLGGPALPEPSIEEEVPDPTSNHQYNRNVVWTFEDIQMLIGTDMPIFGGGTHPCISLRLRDMSSPINVLTGIDYWLDNLMSNVPEVVMCYHLNGIVQKYELIKTEDLPHLENSKFSPKVIQDIAQNILSFLRSNATKAGHTYWLFKGKDDDVVKLYDLTSLCSEVIDEKGQNPFTIPVAMLLYRVARNMKHSSERKQPGTIKMLLKNCINLLPKEKYPQIVTSSHYMVSDLYVPASTNPACPGLEAEVESNDCESCYEDDEDPEEGSATKQLRLNLDNLEWKHKRFEYKPPPPIGGTLEDRCQQALYHIAEGLDCLQYFAFDKTEEQQQKEERERKRKEEDNPTMAKPFEAIPMPYEKLNKTEKTEKKKKKKNKKKNESLQEDPPTALLLKTKDTIPSWQEPHRDDNISWNLHLKILLFEKACLVYAILAEHEYVEQNYGSSLRYINLLIQCQQILKDLKCSSHSLQESCLLGRAGDSCLMIFKTWEKIDQYNEEMSKHSENDLKIIEEIDKHIITTSQAEKCEDILPEEIVNKEQMLLASCKCYERAIELEPITEKENLSRRLGNIKNELGNYYMNEILSSADEEVATKYFKKSLTYLEAGVHLFESTKDPSNLALLLSNMGRLMRTWAHARSSRSEYELTEEGKAYYNKAFLYYQQALQVLVTRDSNPLIWDAVHYELSSALFTMARILQDYPYEIEDQARYEKELTEVLLKVIRYCDVDTPSKNQPVYQFRLAKVYHRLASLYHKRFRNMAVDDTRRKQLLQLCKINYEKASKWLWLLEEVIEFLSVQMERVALFELQYQLSTNMNIQIKHLQSCLEVLVEVKPVLNYIIQRENEKTEKYQEQNEIIEDRLQEKNVDEKCETIKKEDEEVINAMYLKRNLNTYNPREGEKYTTELGLLFLMQQRLQNVLKFIAKLSERKLGKDSPDAVRYKKLYALMLRHDDIEFINLVKHLALILDEIQKILKREA